MKMNRQILWSVVLFTSVLLQSCKQDFVPDYVDQAQQYVVEGYIEAGNETNPTIVLLTSSVPFFGEFSIDDYAAIFVENATVIVNDGEKDVQLSEVCLSQIPDQDIKESVAEELGVNLDSLSSDICIYIDVFDQLTREFDRSYDLTVLIEDDTLTSTTTIPPLVPLDTLYFEEPPGELSDTLAQLTCRFSDPEDQQNYYRLFTTDDYGNLNTSPSSITDDVQFNGKEFKFPLTQADVAGDEFDPNTYGFFTVGDTVTIKWTCIDQAHYKFWESFEYSLNGQGSPFTAYTRISDNIEGGFGIWGGYAVQNQTLVVEIE